MPLLSIFSSLWRNWFHKRHAEHELDDEVCSYLDLLTEEKIRQGLTPRQARRAARIELGGIEQVKEEVRDVRIGAWLDTFVQDLRFGLRVLRRSPGFTAVAVLTLALGIGATTAIFSVVYGVLLRPLPYPNPSQIVRVWEVNAHGNRMNFTDPNFEDFRSQNHSLQGLAEYSSRPEPVSGGSEPTRAVLASVSRDFFFVFGVEPFLGRGFAAEDQRFGAPPVALVSYSYWKQYLRSATELSAIKLTIENHFCPVIGVLPPGFGFPANTDVWVPRERFERLPSRTAHNWRVVGRLRDGVTLSQARSELSAIAQRLKQQYGQDTGTSDAAISPLQDAITSSVRPALLILLGAVAFLLLVACANVVNLLLAQAAAREKELAIRTALGAGRSRLVRQFLTEALLLSLAGGLLGVFTALWGVDTLLALAPRILPRLEDVSVNLPVFLFALGVSVAVAAMLGVITALRAASGALQGRLAEGHGQTGTQRSRRLGRVIVAAQLASTLVLLVGAGLLGRSLLQVLSIDPGFRTDHIVTMDLALSSADQPTERIRRVQFLNDLFARLRGVPGVEAVGGTHGLPLTSGLPDGTYLIMNPREGPPRLDDLERLFHDSTRTGNADYCVASEGYFRALGIPLLRGRLFGDADTLDTPHVAVISQSLAREKWPDQDPLGHALEFGNMDGDMRILTVAGVVGDIREDNLEAPPRPTIYVSYRQRPMATSNFTIVLRTGAEPSAMLPAAREILRNLDPNVSPRLSTFTKVFSASLQARRFNLILIGVFAATALLLSMAGVYGVMAYAVARRTREIGVRIALGALPRDILLLVLGQGMIPVFAGVALGLAGAVVITRLMASLLFGVGATDPLTFGAVAIFLALIALLACYIPARRATRVDPMIALRFE